jgi:hypothetical protein
VEGTATNARPEVGRFSNGVDGTCTATLIAPRVALTAAHCLSPMYVGTTPHPNARLLLAGGAYAVDRIHSFGNAPMQFLPFRPWGTANTDIALLHLVSEVPPSVATPAAISGRPPRGGERSTMFGFGCASRSPREGSGFKRYFTFVYGRYAMASCKGDSGGPVFFGGVNEAGTTIWGVSSGTGGSGGDRFASAAYFKPQIEEVLATWDGRLERGFERPGMSYVSLPTPSASECFSACLRDGRCRAFSWDAANTGCYLKGGASETVPRTGFESGIVPVVAPFIDRPGSDYRSLAVAGATACASACARDERCRSWTVRRLRGENRCWLKNAVPAAQFGFLDCDSGVMDRAYETGWDRPGADIASSRVGSRHACATSCARNPHCRAYTFTGATAPFARNCFLKAWVPAPVPAPSMTSGVRRGAEVNFDRPGEDYYSFPVMTWSSLDFAASPYICQAACAATARCRAWTYAPGGAWVNRGMNSEWQNGTCYVKSGIPEKVPAQGLTSGVRGLEFLPGS